MDCSYSGILLALKKEFVCDHCELLPRKIDNRSNEPQLASEVGFLAFSRDDLERCISRLYNRTHA